MDVTVLDPLSYISPVRDTEPWLSPDTLRLKGIENHRIRRVVGANKKVPILVSVELVRIG